ncbi:hypothetical protein Tel_09320 [Candidatus Tenderia electrophaga]|jgi:PAS domain S-box-containing protein|uniref:histidine kinase n=1 Tax=Candidatus Tenderia electrophaga TaxID=1748243 RepID=A0A0S2TDW5_9GAMM|nr:hypothetical protein Tel_09320 [Candidatus Tenderia electrophaga]
MITEDTPLDQTFAILAEVQRIAQLGNWELDLVTNQLTWSDEVYRIFGLDPSQFDASFEAFIDAVHPEDRDFVNKAYKDSAENKTPYNIVHRLLLKDGTLKYVNEKCITYYNDKGDPIRSVGMVQDVTERVLTEKALKKYQFSLENAPEAVFFMTREAQFTYVNMQACKALGYSREELLQLTLWDIDSHYSKDQWDSIWRSGIDTEHEEIYAETCHRRKDGTQFPVEVCAKHLWLGTDEFHVAFVRDITERKRAEEEKNTLEAQLAQAQKLESIGRLAGGVAHDFNNMLSVIIGYADLIRASQPADAPILRDLIEIENAATRSRDITQQLLAFSRQQLIRPRPIDLNEQVWATHRTLSRLIGEDIELRFVPGEDLWKINFDPSQIDQIIVNLSINARDAMPNGGSLIFKTANVTLNQTDPNEDNALMPREYIRLTVSDTGSGMNEDTRAHIFEPFFTTKEHGKGTGLGLATVYGIVKQNDAHISVNSTKDRGTTFTIYFPRHAAMHSMPEVAQSTSAPAGTGTILLVEDDDMVRKVTHAMLTKLGYQVLAAATPREALSICDKDSALSIDLLLIDLMMPEMTGTELRREIENRRPGIGVIFMSGYPTNITSHHGMLDGAINYLQKPFHINEIAHAVKQVMGAG